MALRRPSEPIQKALGWSILQSAFKLTGLYGVGKLMALWFGPAGLALIGQFQNLLYLQQNAGGAAVHNALIQGMSQQKAEGRDEESYLRKGLALGMILSLGVALLWWALLPWLLDPVLGGDFPLWPVIILPITVLGSAFWAGALAQAASERHYRRNALLNMAQTSSTVLFFGILGYQGGLVGACLGLALAQIPPAVYAYLHLKPRLGEWWLQAWRYGTHRDFLHSPMWPLVGMALYSVGMTQVVLVLIRSQLLTEFSAETAGWWEGVQRIGNLWVPVISTLMTSHFLPALSQAQDRPTYTRLSLQAALGSSALVGIYALVVLLLGHRAITFLFSQAFSPMLLVLPLHLATDVIKAGVWGLHNAMLARKKARWLVLIDISFQTLYVFGVFWGTPRYGWEAAVSAYAIGMLINAIVTIVLWKKIQMTDPGLHPKADLNPL
jgi:PST family polysaccharide transporter